jgi:hypothetical protein
VVKKAVIGPIIMETSPRLIKKFPNIPISNVKEPVIKYIIKNVIDVTTDNKTCIKDAIRVKDVISMDLISFNLLILIPSFPQGLF